MIRFAVMSDIHVQFWDQESQRRFVAALEDYNELPEPPKFIVINGDLTEGRREDYETLLRLLEQHARTPVFVTMGNHEYYRMWYIHENDQYIWNKPTFPNRWSSAEAVQLFLEYFNLEKPYYSRNLGGYPFIFLSGERYRDASPEVIDHAWLSEEQLVFLEQELKVSSAMQTPIFVFLHQPLNNAVIQKEQMQTIMAQYPQAILFAGDSHDQLITPGLYQESGFAQMGSSSVRDPWNGVGSVGGTISESLLVTVSGNEVRIQGRRHDLRRWVEEVDIVRVTPIK